MQSKMKDGLYAIYRGKEYKAGWSDGRKTIRLSTTDPAEVANGFVLLNSHDAIYGKQVFPSDVDALYLSFVRATYRGYNNFSAGNIREGKVYLIYEDYPINDDLLDGFEMTDRFIFSGRVPVQEIERFEVFNNPVPNFPFPEEVKGGELGKLAYQGKKDPSKRPDFYKLLWKSELYAVGESEKEGDKTEYRLSFFEIDGRTILPFFSSRQLFEDVIPKDKPAVILRGSDFFGSIPENAIPVLNPSTGAEKEFTAKEIKALKNKTYIGYASFSWLAINF